MKSRNVMKIPEEMIWLKRDRRQKELGEDNGL
jgi:hypothetical protein